MRLKTPINQSINQLGTYEKSYRGLNLEDRQFFCITTVKWQFKSAVNISMEFDWLMKHYTRLLKITMCP